LHIKEIAVNEYEIHWLDELEKLVQVQQEILKQQDVAIGALLEEQASLKQELENATKRYEAKLVEVNQDLRRNYDLL
jgi:DNA repair exonuclease SbcCD ATPase subunit